MLVNRTNIQGNVGIINAIEDIAVNSGYNNISSRTGQIVGMSRAIQTAQRDNVGTSAYYMHSAAIPLNSLDMTTLSAASLLGVASTSANDTLLGTGGRLVFISGLDTDWNPITEVVALNGFTRANSLLLFLRINSVQVISAGSTGYNEGVISISTSTETFTAGGLPTTELFATVDIEKNISSQGVFSTPAGFGFITTHYKLATSATDAKPILIQNIVQLTGFPTVFANTISVAQAVHFTADGFGMMPPKADFILRTKASGGGSVANLTIFHSGCLIDLSVYPNAN